MAQQWPPPTGADRDPSPVPSDMEPLADDEPLGLPDYGADGHPSGPERLSAFGDGGPPGAALGDSARGEPALRGPGSRDPSHRGPARPEGGIPPWAIVAIVALQVVGMLAAVGLVVGGAVRLLDTGEPAPAQPPAATPSEQETDPEREPGEVTDSAGRPVTDGTGGFDDPATVGEHTVSWSTWSDGTISVTPTDVDTEATLPGAAGEDVVEDGFRMVMVTFEVRYDGPGRLAPVEELWLTGESERSYYQDAAEGLVPDPMEAIEPLGDGESATFRSIYILPEPEVAGFRLGVETFNGEVLYFDGA
ncbi:hypothetical protein ACFQS2_09780 [Brachybacterium sp. GCM10030267]|uniref:hypothetical protein n=1 Tax=Brachybacterium sp. GCM10030267 TaxID=3273381 RepID=UPI00361A683E